MGLPLPKEKYFKILAAIEDYLELYGNIIPMYDLEKNEHVSRWDIYKCMAYCQRYDFFIIHPRGARVIVMREFSANGEYKSANI